LAKQITYIRKPINGSHQHITHCGNVLLGWELTSSQIIQKIESNVESYYVQDSKTGKIAYLGVVKTAGHAPFLRTHADGFWSDNLLSLPNLSAGYDRGL
jgi:hypothetical protein